MIYPSFGSLGSWRAALDEENPEHEKLLGEPAKRAQTLLNWVEKHRDSTAPWPLPQTVIRGMAIELAAHFARTEGQLPEPVLRLLSWSSGLPSGFLSDTAEFFEGGWKGGRPPKSRTAKSTAAWLDRLHHQATGELMPVKTMTRRIASLLGAEAAPARSTIRQWREEADYLAFTTDGMADLSKPG